jgi:hypothetical protein
MNIKNIMALAAIGTFLFIAPAKAATEVLSATLLGENEVPPINSNGTATFHTENPDSVITFSLTFSSLSSNLVVSHLHFATKVAGAVMPACPAATSGTITGTIVAAKVTGTAAQGSDSWISLPPWKPSVMVLRMQTCTRRSLLAERFEGKSARAISTQTMATVTRATV